MKSKKSGFELVLWGCLYIHRNPSSGGVSGSIPIQGMGIGTVPLGDAFGVARLWLGQVLVSSSSSNRVSTLVAGSRGLWHCGLCRAKG